MTIAEHLRAWLAAEGYDGLCVAVPGYCDGCRPEDNRSCLGGDCEPAYHWQCSDEAGNERCDGVWCEGYASGGCYRPEKQGG